MLAVIPAYNEERAVAAVIAGVKQHGLPVLVVDDASHDTTAETARAAGADVLRHHQNQGKGGAVLSGVHYAREHGYSHILVLDADGQHDTAEIPRFIEALEASGADIVLGTRMGAPQGMPLARYLTNRFTSLILSILAGRRVSDSQSGYRLMSLRPWEHIVLESRRYDAESEFLVKACRLGYSIVETPISTIYGDEVSKVRPFRDTLRFFRLVSRLVRWLARQRRQ